LECEIILSQVASKEIFYKTATWKNKNVMEGKCSDESLGAGFEDTRLKDML
jgi:hypothetical protein